MNFILHHLHDKKSEDVGVTCVSAFRCAVVGSCIMYWKRRVIGRTQQFELRGTNWIHESCNGTITGNVAEYCEMAASLFIQTSISHINTLHNCFGSCRSPEILSCAWSSKSFNERRNKEMSFIPLCPPDEGIMASSYRPQAPRLLACGRKPAILCERGPVVKTGKGSHCITDSPSWSHLCCLPKQQRCRLVTYCERLNTLKISQASILIICLHSNSQLWWVLDKHLHISRERSTMLK